MTEIAHRSDLASSLAPDTLETRLRETLAPGLLLVREIGAGGMARVFLAREPALKRLVAVKVLSGDLAANPESRARFEREAQAVAQLSHPNIVAIHTVGELSDRTPYFIMQFVEGRSMSERVAQDGTLGVPETRRIVGDVAAALRAAHAHGIIHRDVKPANVLYEDTTGRVLVSDFGIAAMNPTGSAPAQMRLTGTGLIVGTPQYMSPEQLLAEPVTEKTDVYSLGLLAHELLVGAGPFKASNPHELIAAHLRDTPARLSTLRADVDPELDEIVARCLQKDAIKRPTAAEVAQRLNPGGAALLEWPPPGLDDLAGRMRWLARPWVIGGSLILAAAYASLAYGTRMQAIAASPATLMLLVGAIAGVGFLIAAMYRASRVGDRVGKALAAGYGWTTLVELLCDTRGDTGNLITGSREYAPLTTAQRDRWRKLRIARELAFLASGLFALATLILYVILGSASDVGESITWVAPVVTILLLLLSVVIAERERVAFDKRRVTRKSTSETDALRLAEPWNESFERAREGQRVGRGARVRPRLGKLGVASLGLVAFVVVLLAFPLIVVATMGPAFMDARNLSNQSVRRQQALADRPMALPRDSTIAPIVAGRAFHQILRTGAHTAVAIMPENDIPALPRPVWRDSLPAGLFPATRATRQFLGIPDNRRIFAAWRSGFSAAEIAHLERIARDPSWRAWETLARARALDFLAARYRFPWPDSIAGWWSMPWPRYGAMREMAHASASRAAWHLARGRRDSAEAVLRQTISVGIMLIEDGFNLTEQLVGVSTVRIGRESLLEMWEQVGDSRARDLRLRLDATSAMSDGAPAMTSSLVAAGSRDVAALRRTIVRMATDSTQPRGTRVDMLRMVAITPCTNLRELVFGHAEDVQEAFAAARRTLARSAADSAYIDLVEQTPERLHRYGMTGSTLTATRIAGRLLFNPRVGGCTAILLHNALQ